MMKNMMMKGITGGIKMDINSKCIKNYELKDMNGLQVYFCYYDRMEFTESEWEEFLDYHDALVLNIMPDDPLTPREIKRKWFSEESEESLPHRWLVLNKIDGKIIGRANISFYTEKAAAYEDNRYTADLFIDTHYQFRRRGIGTELLKIATEKSLENKMIKFQSDYILDISEKYCSKYGFKTASDRSLSRLYLKNVDWEKMENWSDNKAKQEGVTLEVFKAVPEDYLTEFCKVYTECGKMAPDYDGDYTATEQITPESVRRDEEYCIKHNYVKITVISKEKDGRISGLSDVSYDIDDMKIVYQGLTGVLLPYRKKGVGKWLKSAILFYLKENCPKAEYIETGNNKKNVAVLAINTQMGYKVHYPHVLVTAKVDDVMNKLEIN